MVPTYRPLSIPFVNKIKIKLVPCSDFEFFSHYSFFNLPTVIHIMLEKLSFTFADSDYRLCNNNCKCKKIISRTFGNNHFFTVLVSFHEVTSIQ